MTKATDIANPSIQDLAAQSYTDINSAQWMTPPETTGHLQQDGGHEQFFPDDEMTP
ncbi:hypothetical protein EC988_005308, partial [Linderina pennispora]